MNCGDNLLPHSKFTITGALQINLKCDFARMPLYAAKVNGVPVWYVITDVSDAGLAHTMGVNFAPRLANVTVGCPGCAQVVRSPARLGTQVVERPGKPDFSLRRVLVPGPKGFPPITARPGGEADLYYSPFVKIAGTDIVYDAPIVAAGGGSFDTIGHTNTHDRLLAIDTKRKTADLAFIRGFSNGKPIFYLSFEASTPLTATIERSTFAPGLGLSPAPDRGDAPRRLGPTSSPSPTAQPAGRARRHRA